MSVLFKLSLALALALFLAGAAWRFHRAAWQAGYDARSVEIAKTFQENLNDANIADDAARRCSLDPRCRLSDDGYRRD